MLLPLLHYAILILYIYTCLPKKMVKAQEASRATAINLVQLMVRRNNIYRVPCFSNLSGEERVSAAMRYKLVYHVYMYMVYAICDIYYCA